MSSNIYLLTILGKLAPTSLEAARNIHNQTAGNPAGVATARALGDLSHMVYIPTGPDGPASGQFLIQDQWNNLDGLNKFFADHQVQEGGNMIFSERTPIVWAPAEGFFNYHLPAPYGKNDRYLGVAVGPVKSAAEALKIHNDAMGAAINQARLHGCLSHEAYFRMGAPGSPETLQLILIDTWMDHDGMDRFYDTSETMGGLMSLFAAEPMAGTWTHPAGSWVEW